MSNFFASFTCDDQSKLNIFLTHPSHQDEPFQHTRPQVWPKYYGRGKKLGRKRAKLARYKCHLHFNLRCLSQNIVPKGVKLNLKQFQSFNKKQIVCKTHRSILNSPIRDCNKIINKLKDQIISYKTSIKSKLNTKDFKDMGNAINKTKEIVVKQVKH